MKHRLRQRPAGFTLIELAVVMVIIGLLMALILGASYQSLQRAEQRATQALITKLETGLNDRLEALLSTTADVNRAHEFLAAVYNTSTPAPGVPNPGSLGGMPSPGRAATIARFDYIKSEVPDVFYIQTMPTKSSSGIYPLNFAGLPYDTKGTDVSKSSLGPYYNISWSPLFSSHAPYILPLGNSMVWNPPGTSFGGLNANATPADLRPPPADYRPAGRGIYGASYTAAAGIYKNLGYSQQGYDGTDNNGNGLVDEWDEGIAGLSTAEVNTIIARLSNHQHKTARSEMLYALLVEGQGPLGSIFSRDDFTDREVMDTDNDGLPEFVDGWGEPLQFYRWPIHHISDIQKGIDPYNNMIETRQQDPLDPGQQLVAPAWWWSSSNTGLGVFGSAPSSGQISEHAFAFQNYFHGLVDFNSSSGTPGYAGQWWDRGGYFHRRAFFSKFLIASSGPDRKLGIARLGFDYSEYGPSGPTPGAVGVSAATLINIENNAANIAPNRTGGAPWYAVDPSASAVTFGLQQEWGGDDITNQNFNSPGGGAP